MKAFRVIGEMETRKRSWQKFTREVSADDEDGAKEKILSDLGSRHRKKRRSIRISSVNHLSPDEISDPVVRYEVRGE